MTCGIESKFRRVYEMASKVAIDPVRASVLRMVKYTRAKTEQLELEVRVGKFDSTNKFTPGFDMIHRDLFTRLLTRFKNNVKHRGHPALKGHVWTGDDESYVFIRCEYPHGLRQTCRPPNDQEFTTKKQIGKIDFSSDRQYQIRFCLSKETNVVMNAEHPAYATVQRGKPNSFRFVRRHSFVETVPALQPGIPELQFQWDLSKVSPSAPTKKNAANGPCRYHCEIELKTPLTSLGNTEWDAQHDELVTDMLLSRARRVLGTSYIQNQQHTSIPLAQLFIIKKDNV